MVLRISIPDRPSSFSSSFSSAFPLILFLFLSRLCFLFPDVRSFHPPSLPTHRSFRTNERSTGGARVPPCFSRYEIRSTVVRHAKDAPMKQMRVMVRKPGTLYRANALVYTQCAWIYVTFMICAYLLARRTARHFRFYSVKRRARFLRKPAIT